MTPPGNFPIFSSMIGCPRTIRIGTPLNRYLDVAEYLGAEMKDADKYILPRDIPRAREAEKLISHPKSP